MITVSSSNIAALEWATPDTLRVQFHTGAVYQYDGVPRQLFDGLLVAESIGKLFNTEIRSQPDRYPYQRIV